MAKEFVERKQGLIMLKQFKKSEDGATAIEYALISSIISIVIVVSMISIGSRMNTLFIAVKDIFV